MDRTPLGGGATVGLQLAREWAGRPDLNLLAIGSGPETPAAGVPYVQLPEAGRHEALAKLSEMGYARFCREFERSTTEFLLSHRDAYPPGETTVIVNDISEGPDLDRLAGAGYRILSIWHVDVVEFFNRIYLQGIFSPERWTRGFDRLRSLGVSGLVPDVLQLVFEKQRQTVARSDALIVPSRQMGETVRRCYAHLPNGDKPPLAERVRVVPWGGWREPFPEERVAVEAARLRTHYQLSPSTRVVLTMSRISPEKGIHLLLEAFAKIENSPQLRGIDTAVFVCGETAFMRGEAYGRRVRRAAERLRRTRVFFPGYLSPFEKRVYFRLADLFASPSLHESYGLTIVEALQEGLPVLASDHYGVDEILAPEYGWAVPYARPARRTEGLAAALAELLPDPERMKRMGKAARRAAEGMRFSDAAERVLESAIGLASAGGGGR
jgi:glycosyltransferase involved in cell wall biosynthesis